MKKIKERFGPNLCLGDEIKHFFALKENEDFEKILKKISYIRSLCMIENIQKYISSNKKIFCLVGDNHRKDIEEASDEIKEKYKSFYAQKITFIKYKNF
jgi:hypothetical protein